jgi:hypothetical protein
MVGPSSTKKAIRYVLTPRWMQAIKNFNVMRSARGQCHCLIRVVAVFGTVIKPLVPLGQRNIALGIGIA